MADWEHSAREYPSRNRTHHLKKGDIYVDVSKRVRQKLVWQKSHSHLRNTQTYTQDTCISFHCVLRQEYVNKSSHNFCSIDTIGDRESASDHVLHSNFPITRFLAVSKVYVCVCVMDDVPDKELMMDIYPVGERTRI